MTLARILHRFGVLLLAGGLVLLVGTLLSLLGVPMPAGTLELGLIAGILVLGGAFVYGLGIAVELAQEGKQAAGLK